MVLEAQIRRELHAGEGVCKRPSHNKEGALHANWDINDGICD